MVSCWLLYIGYWLLVIGCWLLVVGYWLFVVPIAIVSCCTSTSLRMTLLVEVCFSTGDRCLGLGIRRVRDWK
ncbi:hypothetical protein ESW18_20285 [Algoriphagus ratkowskyi]|uniref:Uncharacterized protein n=1 Tax=Algoriphagus ratkowskyi TaxID=57028 RepID=A0ABY3HJY5_9BACT|nr:hypothetical protein ESW18_20285 [Algoriphagus ratkowskyi]